MLIPRWFQIFLASVCLFGTMLLFFGSNNAATTSLREVDASIGLIQRPKNSRILQRAEILLNPFRSVKAEAQFLVSIAADLARNLEYAIKAALNALITAAINFLMNAITGFFNDLVNQITSWIGQVDGLKDNAAAWESAISMKAYQIAECLEETSYSVADKIIGEFVPPEPRNDVGRALRQDFGVAQNTVTQSSCQALSLTPADYSLAYNTLNDAISSVRVNNLVLYSQTGTQDTTLSATQGNAGYLDVPAAPQSSINGDIATIANVVIDAICVDNDPVPVTPNTPNIVGINEIRQGSGATCVEGAIRAGISRIINIQLADDIAIRDRVAEQIKSQAPDNCQFGGISQVATANTGAGGSIAAGIVQEAQSIEVETLDVEQCNNLDRLPSVKTEVETNVQSASASTGGGGEGVSFAQIVAQVSSAFTNLLNNVITNIFNSILNELSEFVSSIGNSYVRDVVAAAAGSVQTTARSALQTIQEQLD